jgi:hypothetical protein
LKILLQVLLKLPTQFVEFLFQEALQKELKNALEGKEPKSGEQRNSLSGENLSTKDLESLKQALKEYQSKKSQSEQMRSELKQALEQARKGTSSGKSRYTTDSRLKDRDTETGKGGVEDGPGTTNKDSGPSRFDTTKKGKNEYVEDRTKSDYERLFRGQREEVGNDPLYLQNRWNESGNPEYSRVRSFGAEKDSVLQGNSPLAGNQNQNESDIRKERVPPSYQEIVKKYFESIEE